jgi:hypothetical protein
MTSAAAPCEITLKKINNEEVVPLKTAGGADNRPIKGEKLFSEVFANVYLCARKKSGKTVVISKIIQECAGRGTTVLAFVSTINKDKNWLAIRKWCEKHKIAFEGFPSIKEHKIDFLEKFLHRLEEEAEEEILGPESEPEEATRGSTKTYKGGGSQAINFFGGKKGAEDYDSAESDESSADDEEMFSGGKAAAEQAMAEKRLFDKRARTSLIKRDPYQAPEYMLIFDDLSHELKLPSLVSLLKKNRHYKLKVLLSSQYLNDLKPESIKQLDYLLLFKGQSDDKLQKVIRDADLAIDLSTLKTIYDDATREDFGFLYVDVRNDQFRKNFSKMYCISKPDKNGENP